MIPRDLNDDLPWYINGSLPAERQEEIARQLLDNQELKQEAEFLNTLRNHVKQQAINTPGEMGLHRLRREIKNKSGQAPSSRKVSKKWSAFAIAASLMLVIQAGFIVSLVHQDDPYAPLSGTEYPINVIQVQFNSNAKASDIRELLTRISASIIDGPSKKGVYRIQVKHSDDEVINKLKNSPDVIDFAARE